MEKELKEIEEIINNTEIGCKYKLYIEENDIYTSNDTVIISLEVTKDKGLYSLVELSIDVEFRKEVDDEIRVVKINISDYDVETTQAIQDYADDIIFLFNLLDINEDIKKLINTVMIKNS